MKKWIVFALAFLFCTELFSQGEIDDQKTIVLRNEITYAFMLNSNGWGGSFRYARRRDGFRKTLFTGDLTTLKHPKEIKSANPYIANTNHYVYGKTNFVLNLRGGLGMQKEFISKHDKGGISIRYFYSYGPSLAIMKPIYYEILYNNSIVKDEKFDEKVHRVGDIVGKASINKGMDEISIAPGGFFKFGVSFEYSKRDKRFKALEAGVIAEAYLRGVEIMASNKAQWFYPGIFLSWRFGRVIQAKSLRG